MSGRSTDALVEPAILVWARASAGLSVDEAARSLQVKPEKVVAWERGTANPSMSQLRKMATTYKRLLSDFYLPEAPLEDPLPHDFQRLPGEVALQYSKALRYQLRQARQRRRLALDLVDELELTLPSISRYVSLTEDPEEVGAEVRALLGISLDTQRSWRDARKSYNAWRASIEVAGVLVFQAAGIPPAEMLGFALSEKPLPVIGINRKLTPNDRTFTLLHEFVHLLLQQSSICDIDDNVSRPAREQQTEIFCNAVAAAALVPIDALRLEAIVAAVSEPRVWTMMN